MAINQKLTKSRFKKLDRQSEFEDITADPIGAQCGAQTDGISGIGCLVFAYHCTGTNVCFGQCVCGCCLIPASTAGTVIYCCTSNWCGNGCWRALGFNNNQTIGLWQKINDCSA